MSFRLLNKRHRTSTACTGTLVITFNINDLSSAISGVKGLSYSAHYSAMISTPKWTQGASDANGSIIRNIPFLCKATQLPGGGFQTTDIRPHGYGLFERRPIFMNFTPVTLSLYCDAGGAVIKFFQSWLQNINNFQTDPSQAATTSGAKVHDFNYPDWYETGITITTYDATGQSVLTYNLNRAYPLTMNNIDVSWEAENQLMTLDVEMFFYSWSTSAVSSGQSAQSNPNQYSMTRVDPNVSGAGSVPSFVSAQQMGTVINNFTQTTYAPLAQSITAGNIDPSSLVS